MAVIAFQKPEKVVMQKASDFEGTFEFSPLERGYGVTIGNSLRRILLSSLEGFAITSVRINGVDHEFSSINGVIEDVTEIVLNLKQVRFKANGNDEIEKVFVAVNSGDKVTAGDIGKASSSFSVLNPELLICHKESNVKFEMELRSEERR